MRKVTILPQRKKIRAGFWDYANASAYFITIVTQNRIRFFGEIVGEEMVLSPAGQAALDCWQAIPQHFPDVVIDEFIVMPDHVHGLLIFTKKLNDSDEHVENRFGPQSMNLASVVRGFKVGVTKAARLHHPKFAWQARYHDRIVRDQWEYERIQKYIRENVAKAVAARRKTA